MNDNNFPGSQELLRDDQGAESFDSAAAGVSKDMRVAFFEAKEFGGIKSCIHTGQNEDFSATDINQCFDECRL